MKYEKIAGRKGRQKNYSVKIKDMQVVSNGDRLKIDSCSGGSYV